MALKTHRWEKLGLGVLSATLLLGYRTNLRYRDGKDHPDCAVDVRVLVDLACVDCPHDRSVH